VRNSRARPPLAALPLSQRWTAARQVAPLAELQRAVTQLEQHRVETGTYALTTLTGATVRLVRADATTYCVEASGLHVAGPGHGPPSGRC
jgi:hypothetical protein